MEEYLGVVKIFAGTYAPQYYMFCQGQLLPISQYTALFSIIGTTYGGDGNTTFALPNLAGMAPIGMGSSPVSGNRYIEGQIGGSETVTLAITNLPAHTHNPVLNASSANAAYSAPKATSILAAPGKPAGRDFDASFGFTDATPDVKMTASVTENVVGSNLPVKIMQPYIAMNYIICVQGIFPPRP